VLGTKCGRYGFDQFDFSEKAVVRGLEDSLRRLKTDHVDILQAHDVEFGSIDQVIHETVPALQRLKEQGKVRFIGVTGYWPHILAHIAEVASVDIVLNYCHWNLMMDDMDAALTPVAERKQLGLMNGSPLHMGLLGGNGGPAWHPAPTNIKTVAARFAALCRDYETDPAILALHACFQHPSVATTFVGPRNIEEVNDALQALEFQPSTDLLAKVSELLAPTFNTTWPSGLPENQPLRDVLSGQTVGAFSRVGSLRT
jgi:L-galactose dehydrogenase